MSDTTSKKGYSSLVDVMLDHPTNQWSETVVMEEYGDQADNVAVYLGCICSKRALVLLYMKALAVSSTSVKLLIEEAKAFESL